MNLTSNKIRTDPFTTNDTRQADYSANTLNQYTSRTVPGYVNILGTATNTATVTMWSPQSSATYTPTSRKGDYFRGEVPFNNSPGPVWATITNLAVLNNGSNPDIVTNSVGRMFIPKTPEVFGYDLDGNVTNDGRWAFYWDAENRLTNMTSLSSAPTGSKLKLDFAYDAQGRRIQKIVSTNNGSAYVGQYTNRFVYDGWNLIAVLSPNSSLLSSYVWGTDLSGSRQGAGGVGGLLETVNYGVSTNFVAYDGNGNVSALVKVSDGTVTGQYEYGPFGELIRASGLAAKANPFRFSTKYQDDESDLLYYGYRFYNQSTGRWLGRDPAEEEGGKHLYGLASNDALNKIDVLGEYEIDFHYYAIYYLLRAKCYYPHQANKIAWGSQHVDDDALTNPLSLGFRAAYGDETAAQMLQTYHFYHSTPNAPTRRNPSDLAARIPGAFNAGWTWAGSLLHTFADSWSHEGFTAWPRRAINYRTGSSRGYALNFVGHVDAAEEGHAPDHPYTDVSKAVEAAMTIYDLIPYLSCCDSELRRATVESDLRHVFSFRQGLEMRVINIQARIQSRFGERPTYQEGDS